MKTTVTFLALTFGGFIAALTSLYPWGGTSADASRFWAIAVPAMCLAAGVAGYAVPGAYTVWGLPLVAGVWFHAASDSPKADPSWSVGVQLSWFLLLLFVACALVGATIRKRRSGANTSRDNANPERSSIMKSAPAEGPAYRQIPAQYLIGGSLCFLALGYVMLPLGILAPVGVIFVGLGLFVLVLGLLNLR